MTVTVFGNGTVTGISAGGLPDGCIQSADIATGTIQSGDIASGVLPAGITLGTAVASTSGATIDFTGIPAGTKRVTISISSLSTSGSSPMITQLGDSGGFETSGYIGSGGRLQPASAAQNAVAFTTGLAWSADWSDALLYAGGGTMELVDASTNTWAWRAISGWNAAGIAWGASAKSLSGVLTQIRMTMVNGSDTFDAGKVNITYE